MEIEIKEMSVAKPIGTPDDPNVGFGCVGVGVACVGGGAACVGGGLLCWSPEPFGGLLCGIWC